MDEVNKEKNLTPDLKFPHLKINNNSNSTIKEGVRMMIKAGTTEQLSDLICDYLTNVSNCSTLLNETYFSDLSNKIIHTK